MADFQPSFLRPFDPNLAYIDPANAAPAHLEPTSLVGGAVSTFNAVVAAGASHYRTRMEEEYGKLQDKFEAAGLKPHRLFMFNEDYVTFPEFQSLMQARAPFPGVDERYQAETDRQASVHSFVDQTNALVLKGKTQRPDLGFETLGEIHDRVMNEIKQDRQGADSISGWRGHLGSFFGGMSSMLAFKSDPFAPAEIATLAFGGVGPNVLTRLATLGAMNAATNVIPQIGSMDTLKQAGAPTSIQDLAWAAAMGFAGGAVFGGVGEIASGAAGRAAMNDRYAWMTLTKRDARFAAIQPPEGGGYSAAFWENKPQEPPTPIPVPAPRAPIPSGVPGAIERLGVQAPSDVVASLGGSPAGYIPRAQRGPLLVLNRVHTKAQKVRFAEDLDHLARQYLSNLSVAPQDVIPPSRPMGVTATIFPEVRPWLGPGVGDNLPQLPEAWQRAAKGKTLRVEDTAREMDPETWGKADRLQEQKKEAEKELARVIGFQNDARTGKTVTYDKHIVSLNEEFLRKKTGASRQAVLAEIDAIKAYNDQLKAMRPGGELPKAPKSMDISARAKRVADLQAKWDDLMPDLERSVAHAKGLWGLQMADAKAFDEALRPGASDWIHSPWRWPVGWKRSKDAPKNPYEIKLLKGPTQQELFAKAKLEFDQQKDVLAAEVTKEGDSPIEVATKVNEKRYEDVGKVDAETFYKTTRDFMKDMEAGGPAQLLPKIGQREAITAGPQPRKGIDISPSIAPERAGMIDNNTIIGLASQSRVKLIDGSEQAVVMKGGKIFTKDGIPIAPSSITHFKNSFTGADWVQVKTPPPSMPAGMTIQDLWNKGAFEFEPGKSLTMKEALQEIETDAEAFTRFGQCMLEP